MGDLEKDEAESAALNARLEKLSAALKKVDEEQAAQDSPPPERKGFSRAMSVGLSAFSEFVGALVAGGLIGWKADDWLGTKPWLLVLMLGIGVAAGFWNIFRLAKQEQSRDGKEEDLSAASARNRGPGASPGKKR